jgi:group I intron endonuclease
MSRKIQFFYVYIITNLILNKSYIGSKVCYKSDPEKDGYWGSSKYLKEDFKKYGIENFSKKIIQRNYTNKKDLLNGETEYILKYDTLEPNGYNRFLPNINPGFYMLGAKASDETIQKLKDSHKGKIPWNAGKNNIFSQETLEKMSLSHLGKKHSEETKQKISQNSKGFIGPHSEDTKIKIGKANTGKKRTPEQLKQMSKSHLGIKLSKEAREKLSNSKKGTKASEEARKNLSNSHKGKEPWNKGRTGLNHSEKTKEKIRKTMKEKGLCPQLYK